MKKTTKTLLLALCALVLVIGSVAGTMAYLTHTTGEVKNTFVSGKILKDSKFYLKEYKATDDDGDGVFTLGTEEVTENEYVVLPGVDIPKQPFVYTDENLLLDAYVFVEVVDGTSDSLSFTVDSANWTAVPFTGSHGGKIYAYKSIAQAGIPLSKIDILTDDKITVANEEITDNSTTIKFYGYMIQAAGFTDASAAAELGLGFTAPTSGE